MKYTVVWMPDAEQELATLWLQASARNAVTQAANDVDHQLRAEPESAGEGREGNLRVIFSAPLAALFRCRPADRLVEVIHVWGFERLENRCHETHAEASDNPRNTIYAESRFLPHIFSG